MSHSVFPQCSVTERRAVLLSPYLGPKHEAYICSAPDGGFDSHASPGALGYSAPLSYPVSQLWVPEPELEALRCDV